MMMKIESLGTSTAKLIYGDRCQDILSLSVAATMEMFKSSGLLVFRDFYVTNQQFKIFAEQFSSKFIRDDLRPVVDSFDGIIHLVNEGMGYVAPHCEGATSPLRPDVIWFRCDVPPVQDGETLFWDGVQVWSELSEEIKQLFLAKKTKFIHHISVENWKEFLGDDATIADVKRTLDSFEGVKYTIHEDQSIYMEYICSAVLKTRYGNHDAFANGIINEQRIRKVIFEDNSPIPDAVIDEINQVMDKLIGVLSWRSGDLAMIDNSRFLHGRRAFNDCQRQIFFANSMLNF